MIDIVVATAWGIQAGTGISWIIVPGDRLRVPFIVASLTTLIVGLIGLALPANDMPNARAAPTLTVEEAEKQ